MTRAAAQIAADEPSCGYYKDPRTYVVHRIAWNVANTLAIRCSGAPAPSGTRARKPRGGVSCAVCERSHDRAANRGKAA